MPEGVGGEDAEFDGLEVAQPDSELVAAHRRSTKAIVDKVSLSLRRRLANASASKLGKPNIAVHAVAREFPKGKEGKEGNERLATPPVWMVKVGVAEFVPPVNTTAEDAKLQVAFWGRLLQLNCNVPE